MNAFNPIRAATETRCIVLQRTAAARYAEANYLMEQGFRGVAVLAQNDAAMDYQEMWMRLDRLIAR